jgi:hypothetical protein
VNDEAPDLLNAGYRPVVVGPQPFSFEDLLRNVDPAPDEETERFVAAIYADRRQAAEGSSPE